MVRTLLSVEPGYLDAAFAAMRERHGTIASDLAHVLGLTPKLVERIRANLLG